MIPRHAHSALLELAAGYPVLALTGPRQSGKTTLARATFAERAARLHLVFGGDQSFETEGVQVHSWREV